jgi:RNA polymerase sigma-70 factor (ECF subfamily)
LNIPTAHSEEELVLLLKERNEKTFNYLYDNYSGALLGIISNIIPDQELARDVLQEVFVSIWKKIDLYDPSKGRLFTWMLNIARNASIDKIRSKEYRNSLKNQVIPDNVDNNNIANASAAPQTEDVGLRKVLAQLKEEYRILVELSYFQGYTHEEIAKISGIPLGTVKTRLRTALTQLRNMIR